MVQRAAPPGVRLDGDRGLSGGFRIRRILIAAVVVGFWPLLSGCLAGAVAGAVVAGGVRATGAVVGAGLDVLTTSGEERAASSKKERRREERERRRRDRDRV